MILGAHPRTPGGGEKKTPAPAERGSSSGRPACRRTEIISEGPAQRETEKRASVGATIHPDCADRARVNFCGQLETLKAAHETLSPLRGMVALAAFLACVCVFWILGRVLPAISTRVAALHILFAAPLLTHWLASMIHADAEKPSARQR